MSLILRQPASTRQKDTAITLRISRLQKAFLSQAARIRHISLTNFVLEEAFQAAQDIISDQTHFNLDNSTWDLFCEALDRPAQSITAVRKLLSQPSLLDA